MWYNSSMNISFESDGSVMGYKTDFLKSMFPEEITLNTRDSVDYLEFPSEDWAIVCIDSEGHNCNLCLNDANHFIEIFLNHSMHRICKKCFEKVFDRLNNIT